MLIFLSLLLLVLGGLELRNELREGYPADISAGESMLVFGGLCLLALVVFAVWFKYDRELK